MKAFRNISMVKTLLLALLMASLFPGLAHAQEALTGKFTLPFEVRWGKTILPAGDYSLTMPSTNLWGCVIVRREPNGETVALIRADTWEEARTSESSKLVFERRGEEEIVRSLYLKDKGYVFNYASRGKKEKIPARGPKPIQAARASTTTS